MLISFFSIQIQEPQLLKNPSMLCLMNLDPSFTGKVVNDNVDKKSQKEESSKNKKDDLRQTR